MTTAEDITCPECGQPVVHVRKHNAVWIECTNPQCKHVSLEEELWPPERQGRRRKDKPE